MLRDYERTLFQKIMLCILAAIAVIFAAAILISHNFGGVQFDGMLMDVAQEGHQTVYTGKMYGEEVTVICYEENGADVVDFTAGNRYHTFCRVEYPEGSIATAYGMEVPRIRILQDEKVLFSGGYDPDSTNGGSKFYHEDGTWDVTFSIQAHYSNDPWYDYELTRGNILYFANNPDLSYRGSWEIYLAALFISLIAAVETAFPETLFYLSHRWHVRDPEPTDFYYATHKISCVVLTSITLVIHIIALRAIV